MPHVNWLAVVLATGASFAIGAFWYSPLLFAKAWQREAGLTDEQLKSGNAAKIFGGAFVLYFLATVVFAMFLGEGVSVRLGAGAGFAAGLFWVAASFGVNYLFERRSLMLWAINGGYNVVTFTAMGTILGAVS